MSKKKKTSIKTYKDGRKHLPKQTGGPMKDRRFKKQKNYRNRLRKDELDE